MTAKNRVIIHISQLEKAHVLDFEGVLNAEIFEIEDSEFLKMHDDLHYKFQCRYHVGGIELNGKVWTMVQSKCGRCLKEVQEKVEAELKLFFDEIKGIEDLDVTEELREELILEIPMNFICSEDCLGLCPSCGINLNEKKCSCNQVEQKEPSVWDALDDLSL